MLMDLIVQLKKSQYISLYSAPNADMAYVQELHFGP